MGRGGQMAQLILKINEEGAITELISDGNV